MNRRIETHSYKRYGAPKKPRFWRPSPQLFAAIFALVVVSVATCVFFVNAFLGQHTGEGLNAYNAAGQFFSMAIGLPLTAAGAALGVFATLVAQQIASRQGDAEVLKFVEDTIKPAVQHRQRLMRVLGEILYWSSRSSDYAKIARTVIDGEGGRHQSPLYAALQRLEASDAPQLENNEIVEQGRLLVTELNSLAEDLRNILDDIFNDIYSHLFARKQLDSLKPDQRPLEVCARLVPELIGQAKFLFGDSIPELAQNIHNLARATRPYELVDAIYALPKDHWLIEFVGHVLFAWTNQPNPLVRHQETWLASYRINFGAAYLISLAQAVPEKKIIQDIFHEIFGDRSELATKFVAATIPERSEFGLPLVFEELAASAQNLQRLAVVDTMPQGPTVAVTRAEIYRQRAHGRFVSDRLGLSSRNEKGAALASRALFNSNLG